MRSIVLIVFLAFLQAGDGAPRTEPPEFIGFVHVPEPQATMLARHLALIVADRWGTLGPGELFHGHILLSPAADRLDRFDSLDAAFAHSTMVLYHSDETGHRFNELEKLLPLEDRTPRSIVGYWEDGAIAPAVLLVPDAPHRTRYYAGYGTITQTDLANAMPTLVSQGQLWEIIVPYGRCLTTMQMTFRADAIASHEFVLECMHRPL